MFTCSEMIAVVADDVADDVADVSIMALYACAVSICLEY